VTKYDVSLIKCQSTNIFDDLHTNSTLAL